MSKKIRKGLLACLFLPVAAFGRGEPPVRDSVPAGSLHKPLQVKSRMGAVGKTGAIKVQYGIASYYSNKFEGRKTYTDEIFSQEKLTGASNTLPMHTWVRVTNLRNHRSVIVQINDKMHPRNRRLIDLTRAAATQLGYAGRGLTRVRVDVLGKKKEAV
jgi:rare lipoprotein A